MATSSRFERRITARLVKALAPISILTSAAMAFGTQALPAQAASAPRPAVTNRVLAAETFRGANARGSWYAGVGGRASGWACLTAAAKPLGPLGACAGTRGRAIDANGKGVLRLTANRRFQSGFAILNTPFSTDAGVSVTFTYYSYGTTTRRGADGLTMMLLNGGVEPTAPGNFGGGIGYTGIRGGWLGVAIDEWGNFSSARVAHAKGGPGRRPNSIAVRGATSAGNRWIQTHNAAHKLSFDTRKTRVGTARTVRVDITAQGVLTVLVDYRDGRGFQQVISPINLHSIKGQPLLPSSLRLGFAASTGGATGIHEISNVTVNQLVVLPGAAVAPAPTGTAPAPVTAPAPGLTVPGLAVPGQLPMPSCNSGCPTPALPPLPTLP